jgi:alpha-L-fucosidase
MKSTDNYTVEDTSHARLQASPQGLQRFAQTDFGVTAHWGLYALGHSSNEWAYFHERIAFETYKERLKMFNPTRFDANEWGDLLLEIGAKFFLITTKHHDGFSLFDTAHTDFSVMNTPFKRDIIAELAAALRDRGIGLHFYYSLVDWTHQDYRTDWAKYTAFYQNQIKELCTNYGEIGGFLFDGYWPRSTYEDSIEELYFGARGSWDLAGTYDLIHSLQPHAVVCNNGHILPLRGEDYQVSELDLPGEDTFGFNTLEVGDNPAAAWWNLNHGWSYQPWNHNPKSAAELYDVYKKARAKNAVLMLNVGPRPFGDIHPQEQQILRELGQHIRSK